MTLAATTSYSTLPSSSYTGLGSQGDLLHSANYGTYDTGIGSLTSHPYQYKPNAFGMQPAGTQQPQYYPTDRYAPEQTYHQDGLVNGYPNSQPQKFQDRSTMPNQHEKTYPPANNNTQVPHPATMDKHQKTPHKGITQPQHSSAPGDQQPSKSNPPRSEHSIRQAALPPIGQHPPSNGEHAHRPSVTDKPPADLKTNKSSTMRAAAIKQKEEGLEQKRRENFFLTNPKKPTPTKSTNVRSTESQRHRHSEQSDTEKVKRNKKQSHSVPKQRKSRRMNYLTDESNSSSEDDQHTRSKSKKRPPLPTTPYDKHPILPPLRRTRPPPPYYDPLYDYPPPHIGHPLQRRQPYYDAYPPYGHYPYPSRHDYYPHHPYEDIPPYIAPYHDPYDGFFDYEKRKPKPKSKSRTEKTRDTHTDHEDHGAVTGNETEYDDETKTRQTKKTKAKSKKTADKKENADSDENGRQQLMENYPALPYHDEHDPLETWRQERNDYLKKKFKPTVHDVLYSQQWMKSDSYLENQRRRALRDSQGYYFPYKQYTLKDYKDLQKTEAHKNPYAPLNDPTVDRKDRAKKRQDYGVQRDRQAVGQNKPTGALAPTKIWHSDSKEVHDPDKLSKRERALEYAKVQVMRNQPQKIATNRSDPTEQYVDNLFPPNDDDQQGFFNEQNRKNHSQSGGDDYNDDDSNQ